MQPFQQNAFGHQPFQQNPFGQHSFQQNPFGQYSFPQNPAGQHSFEANPSGQHSFEANPSGQQPPIPATGTTSGLADTSPESFSTPEDREEALATLLAMGFERSQSEKALRASFYNVETAIEYITSVLNK
jgi:UV excision repair protein RAD23